MTVGQAAPETKPMLKVPAEHALAKKRGGSEPFNALAHSLFDPALLAEGGLPADPAASVQWVNVLLVSKLVAKLAVCPSGYCAGSYRNSSDWL